MTVAVLVPPTVAAVTLEDCHRQLRLEVGDDDAWLIGAMAAATELAERWLNRSLIEQTLEMRLDAFPLEPLPLARPPVAADGLSAVVYDDGTGGPEVIVPTTSYRLVGVPDSPRLTLAYGASWPVPGTGAEAVRLRYVAGYGADPSAVPWAIRQAVLLFVGHWWANREAVLVGTVSAELEVGAQRLLSAYRVPAM